MRDKIIPVSVTAKGNNLVFGFIVLLYKAA